MATTQRRNTALRRALSLYVRGTKYADMIEEYLLRDLMPVEGSDELVVFSFGGKHGQARAVSDRHGRLVFRIHVKKSLGDADRLSFKRNRKKYKRASRRDVVFMPAPEFYAARHGEPVPLAPAAYSRWRRELEDAAGVTAQLEEDRRDQLHSVFTRLPPPWWPSPGPAFRDDLERFSEVLHRRIGPKRGWKLMAVYVEFMTEWAESARHTRSGFPCPAEASVNYLCQKLHLSSMQVRGVLDDLERLGLIARARYVPSGGGRQGHFAWLPGSGKPNLELRRPSFYGPVWAAHCMRQYLTSAKARAAAKAENSKILHESLYERS